MSWDYSCLSLLDREGLSHYCLRRPDFLNPFAQEGNLRMKPVWKVMPGDLSDQFMSTIRRAVKGDPSHIMTSFNLDNGYKLNMEATFFDMGQGLVACAVKNWWENGLQLLKPPTEFDELSRCYLLKKRLELTDPQCVWWIQDTGLITNHRSQLEATLLYPFSQQRLMHVEDVFETDLIEGIMSQVHEVSRTREKLSFTMEETLQNLWSLNCYTIYPLNGVWPKERDLIMMTKNCIGATIWDPQKFHSVEWSEHLVRPEHTAEG